MYLAQILPFTVFSEAKSLTAALMDGEAYLRRKTNKAIVHFLNK